MQFFELGFDAFEPVDHFKSLVHAVAIGPDLCLRHVQSHTFVLDQIVDALDDLDIVGCVEPGVLGVALGFDNAQLAFPKTERAFGNTQNLRHIADFVIFFVEFLHGYWSMSLLICSNSSPLSAAISRALSLSLVSSLEAMISSVRDFHCRGPKMRSASSV